MPENVIRPAVSLGSHIVNIGSHLGDNGLVCCMCQYTNKTLKIIFIPHNCFLTNDVVDKLENIAEVVILSRYFANKFD